MEVISTELISLESAFAIETIEYDELKEHFDAVDAQLAQEAYEQSLMQSFRQVQIDTDRELYEAVCEIQRMIRGWKARTVVQAMKAKKVSGKGKGKEAGKSTKSPPKKK